MFTDDSLAKKDILINFIRRTKNQTENGEWSYETLIKLPYLKLLSLFVSLYQENPISILDSLNLDDYVEQNFNQNRKLDYYDKRAIKEEVSLMLETIKTQIRLNNE